MTSTTGVLEGLEIVHEHPEPVDRGDLDAVEPDRVGAVLGPGAEHPRLGVARIVAWVDGQHIAPRTMQPGQDEDLGTDGQVADGFRHARIEHQPCVRRALEPLLWCALAIDKGRLDIPDRPDLVGRCRDNGPLVSSDGTARSGRWWPLSW